MKTISIFLISLLSFSTSVCKNGVLLKFKNETGRDIKALHVNVRGQSYIFGELKNGKKTDAILVPSSYRYCYAQAVTETDTLVCQPIDYVGETLYTKGKITMTLFIIPSEGSKKYMGIK